MSVMRAALCVISCLALLASCAPKVTVVVEERERGPVSREGGGSVATAPSLPAMPDDGIRLPDLTSMPDDTVFRQASPQAPAPTRGAVTVRPPGETAVPPVEEP